MAAAAPSSPRPNTAGAVAPDGTEDQLFVVHDVSWEGYEDPPDGASAIVPACA